MSNLYLLWFVFLFVFVNSVQGKGMCDLSNVACTSKGAQNTYKALVSGVQGVVPPSDPIFIAELKTDLGVLKYQLNNITMTGFKNCENVQLILNDEILTFHDDLSCSELVLNYNYDAKGPLHGVEVDGKGSTVVTLRDYNITVKGKYGKFISEKDQKLHFSIESHHAEFDTDKDMIIDITGSLHPDETKSETAKAYIRQNIRERKKLFRIKAMDSFVAVLISNIDTYLRNVPVETVLPAEF